MSNHTLEKEISIPEEKQLIERLVERDNMKNAYAQVRKNKGAAGIDSMTVENLGTYLKEKWPGIKEQLVKGGYKPKPVKRVEIPKPDGGTRHLGIPTVLDRLIQQGIYQILGPIFEPTFSPSSYGFRPGRSAHQAIKQAKEYQIEGRKWVVDMDLAKFFDEVNHDKLMSKIAKKVKDKKLLLLIRSYLQAGVMENGLVKGSDKGTPQGSPLSPLLSNIVLDDLDKELEKRGHAYCRYADDSNIYVKSKKAGQRVFETITRFVEEKLKLKVNRGKSAVARAHQRKFLGYSFMWHKTSKIRVPEESTKRLRMSLKSIFRTGRGRNLQRFIAEDLNPTLRGWINYFRLAEVKTFAEDIDGWVRRRLRLILWKQWKRPWTRRKRLIEAGLSEERAVMSAFNRRGSWWNSGASHIILILMSMTMVGSISSVHAYSDKTPLFLEPIEDENVVLDRLHTIFEGETDSKTPKLDAGDDSFYPDATIFLMNILRNWSKWSPRFKENAGAYFLKKPQSFEPISAPKTLLRSNKTIRGMHLLPNWVETQNFSIEWGNGIDASDSGWDSNRVLACSKGATCTGMPDVIDRWAEYFEEVWTSEVEGLGFSQPYGTETYLYDVYIANTMDNIQGNSDDITPFLNPGYLGFTVTYCDYELFDICKDNVTDAYSYIVVRGTITDTDIMKVTAAHEFFHAIQFTFPTIDDWFSAENIWWIEATATWMEEVVYDDVNHYYARVRRWLANPSLSLISSGSQYAGHEYGDSLFVIFLTDIYLHDRDFVRYVWENQEAGTDAIDKVLSLRYHSDFESAFKEFVALNAVADRSSTWGGYGEGENYGSAAVTNIHSSYPVPSIDVSGGDAPEELGTGYIKFLPPDNSSNRLVINFDGSDSINWATQLVKVKNDGTGYDKDELLFTSPAKTGCFVVEEFGTTYGEVFLVSTILIEPTLTEPMPYNYRAAMNSTCEDNSANASLIQADDAGDITDNESGNPRCFIATAAFGSSKSPSVMILREFRDRYLIPYSIGRKFIDGYYEVSPSIADIIEKHPPMPFLVRIVLFPAVGLAFILIKTTFFQKIVLVVTLFCFNIRHTH